MKSFEEILLETLEQSKKRIDAIQDGKRPVSDPQELGILYVLVTHTENLLKLLNKPS